MHNQKIFVIAQNTWLELRHKHAIKLLVTTFIFGFFGPLLIQMKLSSLFGAGEGSTKATLVTTLCQLTLFIGLVSCVLYAAGLLENDTNKRTISTIMIRPIHRWEYLCGRVFGVLFLFSLFVILTFVFAYIASFIMDATLALSFPLGMLQRFCSGVGCIFIAASLGMIFSYSYAILAFVAFGFFSIVFSVIPNDFHWSFNLMSSIFHYLTPAKISFDFIDGLAGAPDAKSFWIGIASLFENILFGVFVFVLCSWLFEKRDLQLREE